MDVARIEEEDAAAGSAKGAAQAKEFDIQQKQLSKLASEVQHTSAINNELPSLMHQVKQSGRAKGGRGQEVVQPLNIKSGRLAQQTNLTAIERPRDPEKLQGHRD